MYLEKINSPEDVKKLDIGQLNELAAEIRSALMNRLSHHGGHFGPNFGIVEATIALHYVFDSPKDKIVFDVSHQTYPHKMLTGRKDGYLYEDKFDSVTGYSCPEESEHDHFTIGHTSTSISLASGLAKGRDLAGESGNVIAVIGDGSLSGGEALEGLDFAGEMNTNFIIVVNDNDMSIAENHGGMYKNLKELRETDGKAECNLFRAMGLDYVYVGDGNDVSALISAFRAVKDSTRPVVVHIVTEKGRGYAPAEKDKESWHWHMPFDPKTGESLFHGSGESYGGLTGEYLLKKMSVDRRVCAITSATPAVFGFTADVRKKAGGQFVDVGIAEEQAAAMASGIAKAGGKPFYGVYSTFVQRTYDQISQDICINNSPVAIAIFEGSVYGMNDVTHLGLYDIAMLGNIPNLVYLAPSTKEEYLAMLDYAIEQNERPVAVRVPAGGVVSGTPCKIDFSKLNKYEVTQNGSNIAIIGLGSFWQLAQKAADIIEQKAGIKPTVINPHFITGVDEQLLDSLKESHTVVATLEDGILDGGFGEKIARFYGDSDIKVKCFGLKKEFLDRYDVNEVLQKNHLTPEQIAEDCIKLSK